MRKYNSVFCKDIHHTRFIWFIVMDISSFSDTIDKDDDDDNEEEEKQTVEVK